MGWIEDFRLLATGPRPVPAAAGPSRHLVTTIHPRPSGPLGAIPGPCRTFRRGNAPEWAGALRSRELSKTEAPLCQLGHVDVSVIHLKLEPAGDLL